jgi:anti-sigma regulatory factor (Ser/Thr protein kinase)
LREGRGFVAATLNDWQVDRELTEAVLLAANELVANAIVHARSAPVLSLERDGTDLLLRVEDTSPDPPVRRPATMDASGGRGLIMIEALADRWGFDAHSSGKVVWVRFTDAFG